MTVKMTLSDDDDDKNDAINIDNDDEYENRKYVSCFMLTSIAHILCIPTHQHSTITMIIITILLYDEDGDDDVDGDDNDVDGNYHHDDDDSLHSYATRFNNHRDFQIGL